MLPLTVKLCATELVPKLAVKLESVPLTDSVAAGATGVPLPESEASPVPAEFTARITTEYSVPLVRPVITNGPVVCSGSSGVNVRPPSVEYS